MGSEMLVFPVFHTSHYFVVHAAILISINKFVSSYNLREFKPIPGRQSRLGNVLK